MKISIRKKLFISTGGLIIFYVLFSLILNNLFLSKYYLVNKKNELMNNYKTIYKTYNGNPQEIELQLEGMERMKGMRIVIQDSNFNIKYDSTLQRTLFEQKKHLEKLPQIDGRMGQENIIKNRQDELNNGEVIIETLKNTRLNSDFIGLASKLSNGDYILISTPVAAINESVSISNKFFLFTGGITLIIGLIFVFFYADNYTKPILQMNKIAQQMSLLDFSKKYTVSTQDEVGQLGNSINSLSDQLEKSISELKEANQKLKKANEKLKKDIERERKIDEMRKEFIDSVSHELKTPIALIQGYAEGLKFNVNEDEENKNYYCEVIIDEAYKMNKLVRQLLQLSQMQTGALHLEKTDFNITLLVEQVIKKNHIIFKEKDINVTFNEKTDYMVNGDYDRIEQVLTNYITNAVNHVDDKKQIDISIKNVGDRVRVFVFNSGKNIAGEYRENIWKNFYKIDKARTRDYGGSGLGLSIVKAIQEAHGNSYGFDNKENGVAFWFDINMNT